ISRALPLKGLATAVNVTDGAGARVHLSSLAAAHFLVQNGIEPIFQMTCRDRNRLALQGDLLGAVSLGIRNVLCLAVDDPKLLDHGVAQRLPILIGVAPIPSAHSARWMREKLYGTLITDAQVARLEKARDPKAEGNRICIEVLQQLAEIPGVAGAHVMAPQNF